MSGKRWWATGLVTVWAVGLVLAAAWSAQHDSATVREQTDLASGRQTVTRAMETVVEAAGPTATAELGPTRQAAGCRLSMARRGTELDQSVVLTVAEDREQALLDRLLEQLPQQWHARYYPPSNRFYADAGEFVAITGGVTAPGEVRLTADTGCRPAG